MKHIALMLSSLLLIVSLVSGQKEMTYKEWESSMADVAKQEQAAKEKIAEEQAKSTLLKDQIKETGKKETQTRAEILNIAGTTADAVDQWRMSVNSLLDRIGAFNALSSQDKINRQGDVTLFEAEAAALKQDRAAILTSGSAQISVVDNALTEAKNGVIQAGKDIVSSAEAAKQAVIDEKKRKIEEAKAAKEEAKRKAEEEKQAKIEENKRIKEEAKQKKEEERQAKIAAREQAEQEKEQKKAEAEAAKEESTPPVLSSEGELQAGSVYKVKEKPGDRETLSKMALRLYGDPKLWTKIYDANKTKIDSYFEKLKKRNPDFKYKEPQDLIFPGLDLTIPK